MTKEVARSYLGGHRAASTRLGHRSVRRTGLQTGTGPWAEQITPTLEGASEAGADSHGH